MDRLGKLDAEELKKVEAILREAKKYLEILTEKPMIEDGYGGKMIDPNGRITEEMIEQREKAKKDLEATLLPNRYNYEFYKITSIKHLIDLLLSDKHLSLEIEKSLRNAYNLAVQEVDSNKKMKSEGALIYDAIKNHYNNDDSNN